MLGLSDNSITLLDKHEDFTKELEDEEINQTEKKSFLDLLKGNMGIK